MHTGRSAVRPGRVLVDLTHNLAAPHNVPFLQLSDHGLKTGEVAADVRNGEHRTVNDGASEVHHSIRGSTHFARCGNVDAPVPGAITMGRSNKLPKDHPGLGYRPVPGIGAEPCGTGTCGRQGEGGDEGENQAAEHPLIVSENTQRT